MFIVGVTVVKGYETERDVKMAPGDSVSVGGYSFRFEGTTERDGPNYRAARGTFDVAKNGKSIEKLHPEKRVYGAQGMPMTEAAIDTGLTGDLYVSLGEPIEGDTWAVRDLSQAVRDLDLGRVRADGARGPRSRCPTVAIALPRDASPSCRRAPRPAR